MTKFPIVITAVDDATATVKKVNESFNRLMAPMRDLGASVKSFSRESGIDNIGKSIVNIGRAASDTAERIGRMVAPLTAVIGVGTIAGVAALGQRWADTGAEIGRAAQTIGESTADLQALTGAATAFGIATSASTQAMIGFSGSLQDAVTGRNQQALLMLNKLGISLHKTKDGAIDSTAALGDLADAMKRQRSPATQAMIANTFGLGALLPFLRQGRGALEAYERMARATGAIMTPAQIANATKFSQQLAFTRLSVIGLGNSILSQLMPSLEPMLEGLRKWIQANRELVASNISSFVLQIVKDIRSVDWKSVAGDIGSVCHWINELVQFIGGWKTAIEIVIGLKFAGWIIGLVRPIALVGVQIAALVVRLAGATGVSLASSSLTAATNIKLLAGAVIALGAVAALVYANSKVHSAAVREAMRKYHVGPQEAQKRIDDLLGPWSGTVLMEHLFDSLFGPGTPAAKPSGKATSTLPHVQFPATGGLTESAAQSLIKKLFPGSRITSGYRTAAENARLGGARNSMHLSGQALDFVWPGHSIAEVRKRLAAAGAPITELLNESPWSDHSTGWHFHWGWRPKGANAAGPYSPGVGKIAGGGLSSDLPVTGKALIELHVKNAPHGTRVNMTKTGDIELMSHVAYALPGQAL